MKALALFSGGLDSMLAAKIISDMGVEVTALHIDIGFGSKDDKSEILARRAGVAGADFAIIDVREEYLKNVLFSPKYGYGKHFNPCIDCHGFMFRTALNSLARFGADFIITGEVLGQRPMSQRSAAINQVNHLSGDSDLIVRPLCAKLLSPSRPEILGWIDREKLLDISGRSRVRQMELAKKFGFNDFETPAGGCLLTLENFSNKIKDALKFEKIECVKDAEILKFGRHLRLFGGAKMVVGRNEDENNKLEMINNPKFTKIEFIDDIVGASSFLIKTAGTEDKNLAAKIALTYAKTDFSKIYRVKIADEIFNASPFEDKKILSKFLIL